MKLFVWNNPYHVRYGGSCLYVIAETIEQAREIAPSATVEAYGEHGGGHDPEATRKIVQADPTRVVDCPCAEIYEWSE